MKDCERCGEQLPSINITTFGDSEPRYLYDACTCPGPRCPFCHARLGQSTVVAADECQTLTCFLFGQVVPVPEIA